MDWSEVTAYSITILVALVALFLWVIVHYVKKIVRWFLKPFTPTAPPKKRQRK